MFSGQSNGTVNATAQAPGHNVYFRPGGLLSSGGITALNIFHEGLHNLTGLGDPALASKLGIQNGASEDINPDLKASGCD
jgi:hypothetical protein